MELLQPGQSYHIYNHANGSENLFREEKNYSYFLQKYRHYISPIADTFAYCLMPNHFHLLIKIHNEDQLLKNFKNLQGSKSLEGLITKQFSNLFNSYSKSVNKLYSRRGSLFNPRFKRKTIVTDIQFQETFLYIHLNPVKHGFTDHEEHWPHSSLHIYASNLINDIINISYSIQQFDNHPNLLYCLKEKRNKILSSDEEFE